MATRKRDKRRARQRQRLHREQAERERLALLAKRITTQEQFEALLSETKPSLRAHVEALLKPLVTYV